jgi:hypothetical protein
MATWTLTNIKAKIERDLGTEDELFIQDTELTEYINEAIRECEAEIHKLGAEDEYFLSKATANVVNGTEAVDLPADIYGNKLRRVIYLNGTKRYPVRQLKGTQKFERYHDLNYLPTGTEDYRYLLTNVSGTGVKMILAPTPQESVTNGLTMWYVRNAKELSAGSDVCDIPEFINFIFQYVKVRIYEKEVGHPNTQKAMMDLEKQRQLMIETLTDMVVDGDNTVEQDITFYEESV